MLKISRRNLLRLGVYGPMAAVLTDGFVIEPRWLAVRHIVLSQTPSIKIIHFTDPHHKGDVRYLRNVVKQINSMPADFVCFTGDIMEKTTYLDEALEILRTINKPMYGVPGNHEYWSHAPFNVIQEAFTATGGAWLVDQEISIKNDTVLLHGHAQKPVRRKNSTVRKNILLTHHPETVDHLPEKSFDLILAGHAHGGQVRLPFWGAVIVPPHTGTYDRGLFKTPSGPLYVSTGIGYWYIPVRFFCRPEIALIEV